MANLLHCPKCCPKKWETVHGVAGSCSHEWEPSEWRKIPDATQEGGYRLEAVAPWGWKCENCGHFKRPRKRARRTDLVRYCKIGTMPASIRLHGRDRVEVGKIIRFKELGFIGRYWSTAIVRRLGDGDWFQADRI